DGLPYKTNLRARRLGDALAAGYSGIFSPPALDDGRGVLVERRLRPAVGVVCIAAPQGLRRKSRQRGSSDPSAFLKGARKCMSCSLRFALKFGSIMVHVYAKN
ncbi:MAG: hypothetical protein KGQ70_07830, partial [Alphaproteobacteria bacterium]|nr:hypothetical protein [Alphaproteobacteria bacterium]